MDESAGAAADNENDAVEHFQSQCIFCGKNFADSVECDRHIDDHLTHQNCLSCARPVILIGSRLYEIHAPEQCTNIRTNQQVTSVDENELFTDVMTSIDGSNNQLHNKKCDRFLVPNEPRRTYRRRNENQLEYSKRNAVDPFANADDEECSASPIKCEICHTKFKLPQSLVRHMQRKHQIDAEFECVQSDPSIAVDEIDAQNEPSPIKCHLCTTEFKIKHTLTRHLHQKHNIVPEYKCDVCGIVCKKYQYLKDHQLTHGAVKRWICSWCGAGYHLKNNLKEHENSHTGARPHKCTDCDKTFSRKALLRAHLVQHTGERPFTCPVIDCQRAYAYYTDLTRHKRGAHGIMSKPHACTICDRVFYERKFLRKHMETHMLPTK